MRDIHRAGRLTAMLAAAGIVAVALLLAGCGSASSPPGATAPASGSAPAQTHGSGPPSASRARALALARTLLSRLVLPPGARPAPVSPLPSQLRQPVNSILGSADAHRLFLLPQPMQDVHTFLLAHVPAGMRLSLDGRGSGPAGVTMRTVGFAPRFVPPGMVEVELAMAVIAGARGGSLLRADAQVSWFPPRAAAEHLDPAGFHALTISARLLNPMPPHTVTRVVTSPAVIARLARLLNGLPAAPRPIVMGCPAIGATYRLEFAARAGRPADVVATTDGCATDQITVNGRAQPVLLDRGNKLAAAGRTLLHRQPRR